MAIFHDGELQVQTKVGVAESVSGFATRAIRDHMPDQHREFYSAQTMVMAGILDATGQPWASPIVGSAGFISSPNATTLAINAKPVIEYSGNVDVGRQQKLGLLGIELATRRRNRVNGVVTETSAGGFTLSVDQSFGNCPKYIQKRDISSEVNTHFAQDDFYPIAVNAKETVAMLKQADTFFIASRSKALANDPQTGVDVSHRGGRPGFIKLDDNGNLIFPDFTGNNFFNTLGNIVADPRVGLFIPNFVSGSAMWINGEANILWSPDQFGEFKGAQRFVEIKPTAILISNKSVLIGGTDVELSPKLSDTDIWA
jgi:predicted pyridoxine 5'-phosphate oxidase superfamily flavin-nucleotide-binding protein